VWVFHIADGRDLAESDRTIQHLFEGSPDEWLRVRAAVVANSLVPFDSALAEDARPHDRLSTLSVNGLSSKAGLLSGLVAALVVLRGRGRWVVAAAVAAAAALLPFTCGTGEIYHARFDHSGWPVGLAIAVYGVVAVACAAAVASRARDRGLALALVAAIAIGCVAHAPMRIGTAHASLVIVALIGAMALAVRGGSVGWVAVLVAEWAILCVGFWLADRALTEPHECQNHIIKRLGVPHAPLAEPLAFPNDLGDVRPGWWLPLTIGGAAAAVVAALRRAR
jgi:hypothetical protein